MKALSLSRPWTTFVLRHGKNVENRTWTTAYRGPLVIHGAQSWDASAGLWATAHVGRTAVLTRGSADHPTGLLGIVELTSMCLAGLRGERCDCGPWAMPEQAHWRLADPRPFAEPVPYRGRLGLWTVPDELVPLAA